MWNTGPARGAGSLTGAKRATALVEAYQLGRDPVWPRCGGCPDPVAFGLAPTPASGLVTTHGHLQSYTDAARRPSRRLTTPTPPARGSRRDGGLDSFTCARCERSPSGGRAIVLNSRSGGTERFLGRRRDGDSRFLRERGPADPIELFGTASAVTVRCHCRRDVMPTKEPSRCGQVMPGGRPVVNECELIGLQSASGRAVSPTQGFRFYSSRLAMRAVRRLGRPHRAAPRW